MSNAAVFFIKHIKRFVIYKASCQILSNTLLFLGLKDGTNYPPHLLVDKKERNKQKR